MRIALNSTFETQKVFTKKEIQLFSEISGDCNPLHTNEDFVKKTIFKKKIVHGALLMGLFSQIFGTVYPGKGTAYLSQNLKFLRPALIGEEITAQVTMTAFDTKRQRGTFFCKCFNSNKELIITGEAVLVFPSKIILK